MGPSYTPPAPQGSPPLPMSPRSVQYAPPPHSPSVQQQAATPNPGMTAIPVQPIQGSQQTPLRSTFTGLTKSIVQIVTNIVTIGLFYGLLLGSTNLVSSSRVLVICSAGFLLINLISLVAVAVRHLRPLSKYIPILFSIGTALTLMLSFLALDLARTEGTVLFSQTGFIGLLGSVGVFSGLGLGSTIMYARYGT